MFYMYTNLYSCACVCGYVTNMIIRYDVYKYYVRVEKREINCSVFVHVQANTAVTDDRYYCRSNGVVKVLQIHKVQYFCGP